jgi:hypothetical protein
MPTPTPEPTPPPSQQPASVGVAPPPSKVGSSASGWTEAAYLTALAYFDAVKTTYVADLPNDLLGIETMAGSCCDGGSSPEERTIILAGAQPYINAATTAIHSHLSFMSAHPAAVCFLDAYAADRAIAATYLAWLADWGNGFPSTDGGQIQRSLLEAANAKANTFLGAFGGYFSDCH